MKVTVYNNTKKKIEELDVNDSIFGVEVNVPLLNQVVLAQNANSRQGTASTKTRSDISGSTRKLFKQKGTGGARPGSIKSPLQYGGGTVFGPHPRDFGRKINKKMFKSALRSVLSDRAKSGVLYIVDDLKLTEAKTKNISSMMKKFEMKKCLIVDVDNMNLTLAARNIYGVKTVSPEQITPYDVLKYENLMITKAALERVQNYVG